MQRYLRTHAATGVLNHMRGQLKGLSISMHPKQNACQHISNRRGASATVVLGLTFQTRHVFASDQQHVSIKGSNATVCVMILNVW